MAEQILKAGAGQVRAVIADDCLRCGMCRQVCPEGAVLIRARRFVIGPGCKGCAACLELCPAGCIELVRDPSPVS